VLRGEVFTDGSCFKEGPVTWHRTGWSVVKVALDGVLLAWMRGVVGRALPQTSPASEHVAGVAAATAPGGASPKSTLTTKASSTWRSSPLTSCTRGPSSTRARRC
jgi:hypothetical protein